MTSPSTRRHPVHFSFEFAAPKTDEALARLAKTHERLQALNPHFFSVTYGAGGSTRDGTRQAVLDISAAGSRVAPHLSLAATRRIK